MLELSQVRRICVRLTVRCSRGRLVLEQKTSRARNQQHLLGPGLVVPETRWARLPGRDDALDPHSVGRDKVDDVFGRSFARDLCKDVPTMCGIGNLLLGTNAALR